MPIKDVFGTDGAPNLDDGFPGRELDEVADGFAALAEYARLKSDARFARTAGSIAKAARLEAKCDAIYARLPAWAKW
jgi:hypothetical protein